MKKKAIWFLTIILLFSLVACGNPTSTDPADVPINNQIDEAQTDKSDDLADCIQVDVDDSVLKTCEEYADSLGCKTGNFQKAVLLGDKRICDVFCDNALNAQLVDKKDIVVIFENIRCVIDAEKGIALGLIFMREDSSDIVQV